MGYLNEADRELIRRLRSEGVLIDVDAHRLDMKNGVIMVTCSDGDQIADIFGTQSRFVQECRSDPRVHTIALNGGAIAIPQNSPLNFDVRKDEVIIYDIRGAMELKGINTIALYGHAPCGAAGLCCLDVLNVMELLVEGKERLKREIGDSVKVACFVHVDYHDSKRTYFMSADSWREWQLRHSPEHAYRYM